MSKAAVTADSDLYRDMFRIEKEVQARGGEIVEDPYSIWAELRAKAPVHLGTLAECMGLPPEQCGSLYLPGHVHYSVFSFAAVSDVFTRKDDFSSEVYVDAGLPEQFGDTILNMDGLRHRRFRDLLQAYFQPAAADTWWRGKIINRLVNEVIGAFEKEDQVELNSRYFSRVPLQVVTDGFGLPISQGIEFCGHMQRTLHAGVTRAEVVQASRDAAGVLEPVIRSRQAKPQDDIISKLACAQLPEDNGSTRNLTMEEIVSFCRLIVFAGGENTWLQMGIALFALLNNRDQLEELVRDKSLIQNAILESTRWYPAPLFPRKAIRDTTLHGMDIPKGAIMHLCLGAANRDPGRWDDPDRYDMRRPVQRSLAFAAGSHSCLGQHVARQEMAIALTALFDRFPNIRWDSSQPDAKLTGGLLMRGPTALHVLLH
jgi:cytochrome P450